MDKKKVVEPTELPELHPHMVIHGEHAEQMAVEV